MSTSEKLSLTNVRLSFARLFVPKAFREGQAARYESAFLLDPSNEEHQGLIEMIQERALEVVKEKFNGKVPKGLDLCFGYADGDPIVVGPNKYASKPKEYDGYEGMFFITSANTTKPKVVGRTRGDDGKFRQLEEEDGIVYSGCYVNATIALWAQDNEFGKRVNANLRAVQFVREGEAFGVAPVDANDEFDEVEIPEGEEAENWDD
mgnify:CR=1 FL=1